jgi:putative FmdB family regulatory protein
MPIYEYICDACATEFEKLVRRAGDEIGCPKCGSSGVTRQASTFAFKGGSGRFVSSSPQAAGCAGCQPGAACSGCRR